VGEASLRVVLEEGLCAAAVARGAQLRAGLAALVAAHPRLLAGSRGVGLMCALEVRPDAVDERGAPVSAWDVCLALGDAPRRFGARRGLLSKPTHGNIIRLTPPLVITAELVEEALHTLGVVLAALEKGA
jgi:acetylornithine/succinyldiaminopimelate/putrescine aminotransferase